MKTQYKMLLLTKLGMDSYIYRTLSDLSRIVFPRIICEISHEYKSDCDAVLMVNETRGSYRGIPDNIPVITWVQDSLSDGCYSFEREAFKIDSFFGYIRNLPQSVLSGNLCVQTPFPVWGHSF